MTSTLVTVGFILVMTLVVPVLVVLLIWRAVRRMLKGAGVVVGTSGLDVAKLRELVAQARLAQSQGGTPVTLSASPTPMPQTPAVVITSMGIGPNIISYLFSAIGAVAAVIAVYTGAVQMQFVNDAVRAEGQVIRNVSRGNRSGYYPIVRFTPEGGEAIEFEGSIGNRPAQFSPGETVGVLYRRDNPADATIDNWVQLWFAPMLSGFFALVFGGIGTGFLIPVLRQRLRTRWARQNGMQTFARFSGVERDGSTRVNGRNPYKVFAEWRNAADGKLYRFQSQKVLWTDPSAWLQQHPDIPLRVDPQDPRRYWLDVQSLVPAAATASRN